MSLLSASIHLRSPIATTTVVPRRHIRHSCCVNTPPTSSPSPLATSPSLFSISPSSSPSSSSSSGINPFTDRDVRGIGDGVLVASPISRTTESTIERVIFDFRFMALLAVGGSLAGSVLCFLNGCVFIVEAYKVYWTGCLKGIHTGQMVLRLVEAIDVYLAGTVMLIFGMGLYGLFISNVSPGVQANDDRALQGSSLFGMFSLKTVGYGFIC